MRTCLITIALLFLLSARLSAQQVAVSTNIVGYANLGTLNTEISYGAARHFSFTAGLKYNPFEYSEGQVRNKQFSAAAGARYWPWHIYSGWWMAGKAQYQIFNTGGLASPQTKEGFRYGMGAGLGYTYMLAAYLNIELGAGAWMGLEDYTVYACPVCGSTTGKGKKFFLIPNDVLVGISYVF